MVLQPADVSGFQTQGSSLEADEASVTAEDPALTPRAWWVWWKDRNIYQGLEESILMIRDVLRERKFDGVLGFSQGAAFAAVISALLERPHLYPPFLVDGEPPHPPFEFCVAVSGFKIGYDIGERIFTPSYSTPTLHVIGKMDVVVIEERSRKLVAVSANKRVEEHEGGHFVPSNTSWRKFLCKYMKNPGTTIPSPNASSSGTATPSNVDGSHMPQQMKL
ncbi:hypothetical protein M378DRAFT_168075 [Amanita muscaria Koide BX008]|uniref:Serine hydrolase domain-containing protein n=1 Tax=Amanita muscaria (strain Koide BX008) TaxID=946122 RepID=A0A0C2WGA9_AMAMK|nr:hypothetical protein M378DRAFT_168075 [Amanita muscaria Koide BX008]